MSRSNRLFEAWSRLGSDMLSRLPDVGEDARRMIDLGKTPYRLATEMHEAWLDTVGGVSKNRYLAVLEENLELRRRLEAVDKPARGAEGAVAAAAASGEAIDGAFKQIRDAQEQWVSMWMPPKGAGPGKT